METNLDMDFSMFGEAGNNTNKSNLQFLRAKSLKVGEKVVARVIPPFKSHKSSGMWAQRHSIHWGYKRTAGNGDPSAPPWMFNFRCVEVWNWRAKKTDVDCPQCVLYDSNVEALTALTNEIEAKVKAKNKDATKDQLFQAKKGDQKWSQLSAWVKTFNCDRKYYLAVKFLDGTYGNLIIGATGYEALKKHVDVLGKDKTIDYREGCYFVFSKDNDSNGRPAYSVQPYQEDIQTIIEGESQVVQRRKKAPLTKEDLPKIEKFCMDLQDAHTANILTIAQVQQLVDEGEGNFELCAELYNATKDTVKNVVELDTVENTAVSAAKPLPKPVVKLSASKVVDEDPDGLGALRKATKHKELPVYDLAGATEEELVAHLDK